MAKPTSSRAKVSNTLDVRRSRGREVFDPESAAKQRQKQRRGVDISLFVDEKLQQNFIDITKDLSEKKAESLAASITKEDQQIREQQLALAAEGLDKRAELLSYYYEEVTKLFYRGSAASTDEIRREFLPALNAIRQDLAKSGLNLKEAKPILDIIKKAQTSFEERIAPAGRVVAKAKSILGSDFAQAALAGAATASPLVALAVFAFNARARKKRQVEIDQELRQQAIERQRRQPKKAAPNKAFTGPDKADVQQSRLQRRLARSKNRSTPKPKPKPQPDPSGDTPTILGPDGNPITGPTTPTATPVILSPSGSVASGEPPIAGPTASRLIVDPSANPVGSGLLVGADGRPLAPPVIGAPRDTLSSSPLLTASGQPVDTPTATPVILSPSGSVASGEPPIAGPTASRVILGPDGRPLTNEPKPSAPPEEVGKTRTRGARSDAVGMVQESSTLTEILTVLTSHTGLLQQLVGISAKQLKLKQREEEQRAQASEETLSETRDGILSDNGGSTDTRTDDDEKKDGLFGKLGNLARLIPGAGGAASSATGMVSRGGGMLARGGGMLARGAGMLLPGLLGGAGSAAAATGGAAAATGAAAGAGAAAGGGLMAALSGLASAVAAVAGPLLLIAAALVVAYKIFKKIDFSAVMEPLAKGFKILWSVVETVGKILYKMLIIPLKIVWAVLSKLADLISFALQPAFDALTMIMKPVIDGISFMWFEVFKPMTDGLLKFADKFESFIDWIINTEPKDIFNAMIDAITSTFKNMVAALMDGFSGLPIVGKYFKQAATALRSSGGAPDNKGGGGGGAVPSAGGGGGGAAPSAGGGGGGAAPSAGGGAPALPAPGSSSSSASRSSVSFSGDGSDPKQVLEFGGESGQLQNFLGLHPVIQNKVILAGQEYLQKTGKKLKVNSAKRDSAKQQELWDESVKAGRPGRGPSGMAIAKPGRSQHERGLAIDIQNYKDPVAVAALNKQGLFQGVPGDPVHFQLDSNPSLDQPVSRAETATAAAGVPAPAAGASTTASTASPAAATPAAPSALPAPGAVSSTAGLSTDTAQGARMELTPSLQAPALPPPQAGGNINMIDASSSSVSGGGGGPTQDRLPAPIDMEPVIRRVITAT